MGPDKLLVPTSLLSRLVTSKKSHLLPGDRHTRSAGANGEWALVKYKGRIVKSDNGSFQLLPLETFIQILCNMRDPQDWKRLARSSKSIWAVVNRITPFLYDQEIAKRFSPTLLQVYFGGKSSFQDPASTKPILPWGPSLFDHCFPGQIDHGVASKRTYQDLQRIQTWLEGMDAPLSAIMKFFLLVTQRRIVLAETTDFVLGNGWEVCACLVLYRWREVQRDEFVTPREREAALAKLSRDVRQLRMIAMRMLVLLFAVVEACRKEAERSAYQISSTTHLPLASPSPPEAVTPSPTSNTVSVPIPVRPNSSATTPSHTPPSPTALVPGGSPLFTHPRARRFILQYRLLRSLDTSSLGALAIVYGALQGCIGAAPLVETARAEEGVVAFLDGLFVAGPVGQGVGVGSVARAVASAALVEEGWYGVKRGLEGGLDEREIGEVGLGGCLLWNAIAGVLNEREEA